MAARLGKKDAWYVSLLCGSLLLLAVQVALGGQGFNNPHQGVLKFLETPGRVVGWGGVAICAAAVPFLLLRWWRGDRSGGLTAFAGALVLAIGLGGFGGLFGTPPEAGGGIAGAKIARTLEHALGPAIAAIALAAITTPGLLLMLRPLFLDRARGRGRAVPATSAALSPAKAKPWYPERRVGPDGLEVPMQLPGSDVGPIRYRDAEPAPAAGAASTQTASGGAAGSSSAPPPPPPPEPKPKRASSIAGVRFADEDAAPVSQDLTQDAVDIPGVRFHRREELGDRLPAGVRFVEAAPKAPEVSASPEAPPLAPGEEASRGETNGTAVASAVPPAVPEAVPGVEAEAPVAAPEESGGISRSVVSHRKKLATTGVFSAPGSGGGASIVNPARQKPKPMKPMTIQDALKGLFSSLPYDELPPQRPTAIAVEVAAAPPVVEDIAPEAPGQLPLFESKPKHESKREKQRRKAEAAAQDFSPPVRPVEVLAPKPKEAPKPKPAAAPPAAPAPGRSDTLYVSAVEAAIERGAASLVLLQRRFSIGYARASTLMDALTAEGIVGEMTASGSRTTLITAAEWAKRRKR